MRWWSRILGGWENWGWFEWMESVTPVKGSELGNWMRWVSVRLEWCSSFPDVVRLTYRGFLLGNGVVTPNTVKTPGRTILEVLEVVGTRDSVQTGGFVGILGWMVVTVVIPMVLVAG